MSFPRAKLQRFNDSKTDVPSPTRYDPKTGDKTKGCVISKGEKERTTSESLSTGGTPFRTPYSVPKKHSCVATGEKPVVARGMNFGDVGVSALMLCPDGDEAAMRSELADKTNALSEFQKLVEELTQQVQIVEAEKTQLELQVAALEAAKAELMCVVSNNQNCEIQIQQLTETLTALKSQLEELCREKSELLEKWALEEKRMLRLEDGNVEYEKRIISLEGTLEQVTSEYNEKVEEVRKLQESGDKLKISIECLQGKISMLENEVTKLEALKSKNEETIFGLEERASSLNFSLEAAWSEVQCLKEAMTALTAELEERKKSCSLHEDTIKGLDMQLESKQKEITKFENETKERISTLDAQITSLTENLEQVEKKGEARQVQLSQTLANKETELRELTENRDSIIQQHQEQMLLLQKEKDVLMEELTEKLLCKEKEIENLVAERKHLVKVHEEEVFHLQNEWEKKIFEQMQESEQALLEKEAVLKLAGLQYKKQLSEAQSEWERQLREAEEEASRRQSAQLEAGEMLKAKYEARIADLETSINEVLEHKAREAAAEMERYREVCDELSAQIQLVQEKGKEIFELTSCNHKISTRLNNMLEEVKLLNSENNVKVKELDMMTAKYNEESKKNEKLSEQLGELDFKVAAIGEELKGKALEKERLADVLKKSNDECNALKLQNLDLKLSVVTHEEKAFALSAELETSRSAFNSQLVELSAELSSVKRQCRKFEIAMADTRKSLEALGKRLMESENEVERLNQENEIMKKRLESSENDKIDADKNYRSLMDVKIDLEQRIQAAEAHEEILTRKVKELELKNCDLELSKNEVQIMKDTLEEDKKSYEAALVTLQGVVTEQNLKMVKLEQKSLEQIDAVSQILISKLEEFERFSTGKIQQLNSEIFRIGKEKEELILCYNTKCDEYENLFMDHDILKTTFDIATKESQSLKKHYEEQRIELDNMIQKMAKVDLDGKTLAEKLETANMASENLARDLEEKVIAVNALSEVNEKHEKQISELNSKLASQKTCIDSLKQQKIELEEKLKNLRSSRDKDLALLQSEIKEHKEKFLKSTDEVVSLLLNLETERNNVEVLERANKKFSEVVKELEQSVVILKENAEETAKAKKDLSDELENIKLELNALREKHSTLEIAHIEQVEKLTTELKTAKEGGDWRTKWEKLLEEKELLSSELLAMSDKKDSYKYHCQRFEKQLTEAENDRAAAIKDFNEIHVVLQDKENTIKKLQKRILELESLIGPFREQLEQYETERSMLENDRDHLRRQHLEQAAKLGHQNHKQKIQHVVKLKADILELRKENQKLQFELKNKNKLIENLRVEVGQPNPKRVFFNGKRPSSTPFKGKENDERDMMSPIMGVKQEPMSPSNPLKERNY